MPADQLPTDDEIDISSLEDSLRKNPWERMQANDDALRSLTRSARRWKDGMQNLSELTRRLIEAQVEFVLVGGFAAVAHGVTLVTRDVDMTESQLGNFEKSREGNEALRPEPHAVKMSRCFG